MHVDFFTKYFPDFKVFWCGDVWLFIKLTYPQVIFYTVNIKGIPEEYIKNYQGTPEDWIKKTSFFWNCTPTEEETKATIYRCWDACGFFDLEQETHEEMYKIENNLYPYCK